MNLSLRHWLAERQVTISNIPNLAVGQLAGIADRIVQDMEAKSLIPLDICTLAEVLALPLDTVAQEITVIALLTESLLRSLSQKKALKRNEGTWLAFQIAYLLALQQVLHQESILQRPWLNRAKILLSTPILADMGLQGLLKTLSPGKLTDTQAEQALSLVADSLLVQQMNHATVAWFIANGAEELEAKLFTQRLTHSLPGYLLSVIAQNALALSQLQKFFQLGTPSDIHTSELPGAVADKIDLHRENYRASLWQSLSTPLLMESFALKDIYVPLVGIPQTGTDQQPVDLKTWVQEQLTDLATIAVIVSEPGYGKTSFCQIWAAEVARELYPAWMPIIIRLREIRYSQNLIETLNSGFAFNQHTHLRSWLTQDPPRCVLLLDGFDELPPTIQSQSTKRAFIQELMQFQAQHRHKIVLTSRTKTVQEFALEIPLQWRQITIEPLTTNELKQWFQQWTLVQSLPIAQNFFTFLKQAGLFARKSKLPALSALVHQPLMLYLLGVLHRDGLLDDGILQLAQTQPNANSSLLWEIYRRLQKWLLGYPVSSNIHSSLQRSGWAHIHRTQEAIANLLGGDHPQEIIQQIQTISLQILHSDRYYITLESTPKTNLPGFYFHRQEGNREVVVSNTQTVAFSHPNLGTYLCAEAVASQLQMLTQCQTDIYGTQNFVIDSPRDVAQHLYKLLGYGILTPEITKLAIASLRYQPHTDFSWQVIIQRLESFWRSYYQGRWLDEGIAHTALSYFHKLENPVNVERINTYVGINIFLLLAQIHKEIQLTFSPCGNQHHIPEFYPEAMLMLLAKATFLGRNIIERIYSDLLAGINLAGAYLAHIMLVGVNFEQTNLANAVLIGANLTGANLTSANLSDANLTGANFSNANFSNANLSGANLSGANLTAVNIHNVNFTNTCLSDAIISETDREAAKFQGAIFSLEQFQALRLLLSQQSQFEVDQNTEQTEVWENQDNIGMIESAEGELMLSTNFDEDADDETVFNNYFRNS